MKMYKRFGQVFMRDEKIAEHMVQWADIKPDETVLEVGAGNGILTKKIAEKTKNVIAIEIDKRFECVLKKITPNVIIGDALKLEWQKFDKIVSNIPYNISTDFTFKLMENKFKLGIITYQKEFAERLCATYGSAYSKISIKMYYRAKLKILEYVSRKAFYPMPKVGSAIVNIELRTQSPFKLLNEQFFFDFIDIIFSQRRKMLKNTLLNNWAKICTDKNLLKSIIEEIDEKNRRPDELYPEELGKISNEFYIKLQT